MKDIVKYTVMVLSVVTALWSLYYVIAPIETYTFRMWHLAYILALTPLLYPLSKKYKKLRSIDYVLSVLGLLVIAYVFTDFEGFIYRAVAPSFADMLFGIICIALVLEAIRRTTGLGLTVLVLFFLVYTYFGPYFPPPLTHRGYGLDRIVGHMYMTLEGLFSIPLDVSASFVVIFVLYGAFMEAAGASKFFTNLALKLIGRGPAAAGRAVVLTTGTVGGPQGSGTATTLSLGPILWPLLKDAGYRPHQAAGLLATGGIGAVISPPIMGAAAFLIMEFLRISYLDVILLVLVPTVLYYVGYWLMVEIEARKLRLKPVTVVLPTWREILRDSYHLASLIVLIGLIVVAGRTPYLAAFWAIITIIVTSFLSRTREGWLTPRKALYAIVDGIRSFIPVATVLAGAGLIIGSFTLTGLGLRLAGVIMEVSMGIKLLALALAAIATIIIGLALPITASYVVTVIIVAPALAKLGVPDYVTHTFVFYYAVLSEVSPPIGLSPLAAASLTGAKPISAMLQAAKYSLPVFVIPILFSLNEKGHSLLLLNLNPSDFAEALIMTVIILFILAIGLIGYVGASLNLVARAIITLCGLTMVVSSSILDLMFLAPLTIAIATMVIGRILAKKVF